MQQLIFASAQAIGIFHWFFSTCPWPPELGRKRRRFGTLEPL